MSVSMYWYKPATARKELGCSYDLKWALAKRYAEHDGSCHEAFTLTREAIPYLQGIAAAAGDDIAGAANRMIADIEKYGSIDVEYK